jgi:hypothetical protein
VVLRDATAQRLRVSTVPLDHLLTRIAEGRTARGRGELAGTLDERVIDAVPRDFPCLNATLVKRLAKEQPATEPLLVRLLAAEDAAGSPGAVARHAQDLLAALTTCVIEEKRQRAVEDLRDRLGAGVGRLRTAIGDHRRIVARLIEQGIKPPVRVDEDHPASER